MQCLVVLLVCCSLCLLPYVHPSSEEASLHSMVFATAPDDQSAKKIARGLVANKLAACVTIVPRITSIYAWEGEVIEDPEVLLMMKTRTSRLDELTQFVVENHPYRVAEVISTSIQHGNQLYLDWISETVPNQSAMTFPPLPPLLPPPVASSPSASTPTSSSSSSSSSSVMNILNQRRRRLG